MALKKQDEQGASDSRKTSKICAETALRPLDRASSKEESHQAEKHCTSRNGFFMARIIPAQTRNNVIERDNRPLSKMECPGCGRLIIPRMIYYQGAILRTVCPFCVESIWERPTNKLNLWLVRLFLASPVLVMILPFLLNRCSR